MTDSYVRHDAFISLTWPHHKRDITHPYVWLDAFTCVTWRPKFKLRQLAYSSDLCDMLHLYAWYDPCICVTWLMYECDVTYSYVWHDVFIWRLTTTVPNLDPMSLVPSNEPYIPSKEPYISSKEPYIPSKESYIRVWRVWCDSFNSVARRIYACAMMHS